MHPQSAPRLALTALLVMCGSGMMACTPAPGPAPSSHAALPAASTEAGTVAPSPDPTSTATAPATPSTGFAFDADSVVGFYEQSGFTCAAPESSTGAEGWIVQSCTMRDEAGRTLGVGVVRDPDDVLGDGFASVTAAAGEDFVTPTGALDHLSGFLGAMLGEERASAQLEWLAGSLGNPYEETTVDGLRVATYLRPSDDPRTIWIEVAGAEYLAAPQP